MLSQMAQGNNNTSTNVELSNAYDKNVKRYHISMIILGIILSIALLFIGLFAGGVFDTESDENALTDGEIDSYKNAAQDVHEKREIKDGLANEHDDNMNALDGIAAHDENGFLRDPKEDVVGEEPDLNSDDSYIIDKNEFTDGDFYVKHNTLPEGVKNINSMTTEELLDMEFYDKDGNQINIPEGLYQSNDALANNYRIQNFIKQNAAYATTNDMDGAGSSTVGGLYDIQNGTFYEQVAESNISKFPSVHHSTFIKFEDNQVTNYEIFKEKDVFKIEKINGQDTDMFIDNARNVYNQYEQATGDYIDAQQKLSSFTDGYVLIKNNETSIKRMTNEQRDSLNQELIEDGIIDQNTVDEVNKFQRGVERNTQTRDELINREMGTEILKDYSAENNSIRKQRENFHDAIENTEQILADVTDHSELQEFVDAYNQELDIKIGLPPEDQEIFDRYHEKNNEQYIGSNLTNAEIENANQTINQYNHLDDIDSVPFELTEQEKATIVELEDLENPIYKVPMEQADLDAINNYKTIDEQKITFAGIDGVNSIDTHDRTNNAYINNGGAISKENILVTEGLTGADGVVTTTEPIPLSEYLAKNPNERGDPTFHVSVGDNDIKVTAPNTVQAINAHITQHDLAENAANNAMAKYGISSIDNVPDDGIADINKNNIQVEYSLNDNTKVTKTFDEYVEDLKSGNVSSNSTKVFKNVPPESTFAEGTDIGANNVNALQEHATEIIDSKTQFDSIANKYGLSSVEDIYNNEINQINTDRINVQYELNNTTVIKTFDEYTKDLASGNVDLTNTPIFKKQLPNVDFEDAPSVSSDILSPIIEERKDIITNMNELAAKTNITVADLQTTTFSNEKLNVDSYQVTWTNTADKEQTTPVRDFINAVNNGSVNHNRPFQYTKTDGTNLDAYEENRVSSHVNELRSLGLKLKDIEARTDTSVDLHNQATPPEYNFAINDIYKKDNDPEVEDISLASLRDSEFLPSGDEKYYRKSATGEILELSQEQNQKINEYRENIAQKRNAFKEDLEEIYPDNKIDASSPSTIQDAINAEDSKLNGILDNIQDKIKYNNKTMTVEEFIDEIKKTGVKGQISSIKIVGDNGEVRPDKTEALNNSLNKIIESQYADVLNYDKFQVTNETTLFQDNSISQIQQPASEISKPENILAPTVKPLDLPVSRIPIDISLNKR